MENILKKLDLEEILEKEMDLWCQTSQTSQTSTIILSNTNTDEVNTAHVLSKISNNLLTNKISETIQNIRIKKQKDFYMSQMPKEKAKKHKKNSSRANQVFTNSPEQDDIKSMSDEGTNDVDIFINSSKKRINSISLKSTSPESLLIPGPSSSSSKQSLMSSESSSDIFNNYEKKKNYNLHPCSKLNTINSARSKLSAFRYTKKSTSSANNLNESNISQSSSINKPPDLSHMFSIGDDDDLSYLDID